LIQIAPQFRILVAIEAIDGRKGIDALAIYAGRSWTPTHFLAVSSSSVPAGEPPSSCWRMMAKGSGSPPSACQKGK
jgi:hypothetical protein